MKTLISMLTVVMALAVAGPALAGNPTTKAACERAGGTWDAQAKKCYKESSGY